MAADTPVVVAPAASEAGFRLDGSWQFLKNVYSGAGTQRECRWQISRTNAFPAAAANLVVDTLLRENDDRAQGDDWVEVWPEVYGDGFASNTTYYVSCMVENTSSEQSAWAAGVAFSTETIPSAANWERAQ